jgi:probable HAF family extracellular repeat protein
VLPGLAWSEAASVSDDGSVVVGRCWSASSEPHGFLWGAVSGMQSVEAIGDFPSDATAVSADGTTIVGWRSSELGSVGFRLRTTGEDAGFTELVALDGCGTFPVAVSADGRVVLVLLGCDFGLPGAAILADRRAPVLIFYGLQGSYPLAISADGMVATGRLMESCFAGICWRAGSGLQPIVPPSPFIGACPLALNSNGDMIAGFVGTSEGSQAFRWSTRDGFGFLRPREDSRSEFARDICDNGSVIVGVSQSSSENRAVVWLSGGSALLLRDVITARGIDVAEWSELNVAAAISGDGRFVVGHGVHRGEVRAFLVDFGEDPWLVCTADLNADALVAGADLGILLSQWGPASAVTVSDLNRDGIVDGADLGYLLANWGPCSN